ncbi:MAG: NTP transferase domain-containing protein [Candidatus Nanopelagicales bacterium]
MPGPAYDAIVLAGGRSSRAGSDKLGWTRDERTLLQHALDAVATAAHVVVVGPVPAGAYAPHLTWRREDPPFGGPVAAITTGLDGVTEELTVVLAGDQPAATPAIPQLLECLRAGVDGAVLVDGDGVRQPLLAAYRTSWLRGQVRAAAYGASVRSLLIGASIAEVPDVWGASRDVDTVQHGRALGFGPFPAARES